MAEAFLESIYKEAKLLCEFKRVVEWTKVRDEHHALMHYNALMPDFEMLCKRYIAQDETKGMELFNTARSLIQTGGELVLLGDKIEHDLLPLIEESMRKWEKIELENTEGDFQFETTASGFLTIKDLRRNRYFHSTIDPMWEAKKMAEYIFDPRKDSYSVRGCGLGYLIYQLYVISEGSIVINVYEKDARMVEYGRQYGVLDWVPEENLNIVVDEDVLSFLQSADEDNVGFYIFLPELASEPEEVRNVLSELYMQFSTGKKFERYLEVNYWRNRKSDSKWVSEFDITKLQKEFIVIAAGPSLDDNMDFLRENQGKKTLVAVGTVFKKLLAAGIVPDMVVVVDPQARTYKQIEGVEEQTVPMLIAVTAYWKFAAAYQGEKYLVPIGGTEDMIHFAAKHKMNLWNCGGTVTSLAIEAAIQFGAEQIYLVGVDLSYPNGITHAEGTMDRKKKGIENLVPVEGVGNQIVYTDTVFLFYRRAVEDSIARTPHITYYNMSQIGVKIHGAREFSVETNTQECVENLPEMHVDVNKLVATLRDGNVTEFTSEEWEQLWGKVSGTENDRAKLIVWAECLKHISNSKFYEDYLISLSKTDCFSWDEKYYLLWQVSGMIFGVSGIESFSVTKLLYENYHKIFDAFLRNFEALDKVEGRDKDLVFVTVQQFLSLNHAPTKTTFDRARVLKTKLGKKVMIINTAESFGGQAVEMVSSIKANYDAKLLERESVEYEGESYPFFQFENNMPNVDAAQDFFNFVKKYKPSYIVNIGGDSLLIDACSKMVPVLNINTVPSKVAKTESTVQVLGRELTCEDEKLLAILGKKKADVITGRFTWSLKPQTHQYTKAELGIPEKRFVMAVVGGRLTTELDNKFVQMIVELLEEGALLVIIGKMLTYDEICREDTVFKENTVNLGMQEDVLAILEHCDLYVNPERKGGGTSVIEAMYKGCPAVTLRGGDVAIGAGEDFCVDSYEDMKTIIKQYMSDKQFYETMSGKAKERAEYMLDSDSAFVEIISDFEKRINESAES